MEIAERILFLKNIHLFYGLDQAQLNAVAQVLVEESYLTSSKIVIEGAEGSTLYLIVKGRVNVTHSGKEKLQAILVAGDYFGEEAIITKHLRRNATITAVENTDVLVLKQEDFKILLRSARGLLTNFSVAVSSRHLARRIYLKWMHNDEFIYFLARKHPILLIKALAIPAVIFVVGLLIMLLSWLYAPEAILSLLWYAGLGISIFGMGWWAWNQVDWTNDYYIVSNQRVVWLEKVIGLYDSRQEAPLSAIQRVNVTTDFYGRMFDYGTLEIRTIVGSKLVLENVDHPYLAAALIEEHWRRSRKSSAKNEEEDMRKALRERLVQGDSKLLPEGNIIAKPLPKTKDLYKGQQGLLNRFRLRIEDKSSVTYKKSPAVLIQQTWFSSLAILILIALPILDLFFPVISLKNIFSSISGDLLVLTWVSMFIIFLIWWIYEFVDWGNDIFRVTADQILDIDKKPFGEVTSNVAALDTILSIEYQRSGIFKQIFNYGDVKISVGGGKEMVFEDVYNPSEVQEDIERRRLERITNKEKIKIKEERERMADWFAAYYHNEKSLRDENATTSKADEDQKNNPSN